MRRGGGGVESAEEEVLLSDESGITVGVSKEAKVKHGIILV